MYLKIVSLIPIILVLTILSNIYFDPSISNYFIGYLNKELNNISVEFQVGVDLFLTIQILKLSK